MSNIETIAKTLFNLPVSNPQIYHDAALEIAKIAFSLRQNSGKEWSLEEITAQFWSDYFGSKEILETAEAIGKRQIGLNDSQ